MNQEINVVTEEAVENTAQEKSEKMFTQSQLEEIISKRLERERRISESLHEVKKVLLDAKNEGLIKGTSFAEMAKELMMITQHGETQKNDNTTEEEIPMSCDSTPLNADEGGNMDTPEIMVAQTNEEKKNEADFFEELKTIKEKHKNSNADMLLSGDLFEKFAKGRSGRPSEIFDDFALFMQGVSGKEKHEEILPDDDFDPYSSTSFSEFSDTESNISGLTKQQMEMAKSAGISYREYAAILAGIPQKKNKNN